MSDDMDLQEYYFYFGVQGSNSGSYKFRPWYLRHVQSFGVSIGSQSTEIGIPGKPPDRAQIFDMSGPVRTFQITGKWLDYEEEITNTEFFFMGNNLENKMYSKKYNWFNPITKKLEPNCVSMSLTQLFSMVQASIPGFFFGIYEKIKTGDGGSTDPEDNLIEVGKYNVALTSINGEYTQNPGELIYSLTLIERAQMGKFKVEDLTWQG